MGRIHFTMPKIFCFGNPRPDDRLEKLYVDQTDSKEWIKLRTELLADWESDKQKDLNRVLNYKFLCPKCTYEGKDYDQYCRWRKCGAGNVYWLEEKYGVKWGDVSTMRETKKKKGRRK